ncbi:MAG: ATPase F0F1 [Planctomyces sp.]|nr:ATPase F0F1 [Planctomyces sp.]
MSNERHDNEWDQTEFTSDDLHLQDQEEIQRRIAAQERRKLRAKEEKHHTVWFGLGMFGLVGWSVAIPAVAGAALGVWIDSRWPSRFSWSLMLLVGGLALGCINAWKWLHREGNVDR